MKLNKLLAVGLVALSMSSISFAKEGGFGIKGGIGLSTISFGNPKEVGNSGFTFKDNDNKWKVGGLVGLSYEARIGNVFGLDIEADLANKGVQRDLKYTVPITNDEGKLSIKGNLFTLDVPVSAKFYLGDNFNFNAGPYFSYILGGKAKATNVVNGNTQSKESDNWYGDKYKDHNGELPMNRFDFGINAGLEFVSNGGFGIGARVQKGFIDLTNDKYIGSNIFPTDKKFVTNTGFQIYGIMRF